MGHAPSLGYDLLDGGIGRLQSSARYSNFLAPLPLSLFKKRTSGLAQNALAHMYSMK